MAGDRGPRVRRVEDAHGHSWRIGTDAEVAWITGGTSPSLAITAAIPPVFDAYATVVLPDNGEDRESHNRAMLALLDRQSAGQRWWLGYLSTGAGDLVFPGVMMGTLPKVILYAGWDYVLVEAGPASLMDRLLAHPDLQARPVHLGEEVTPPGHQAF